MASRTQANRINLKVAEAETHGTSVAGDSTTHEQQCLTRYMSAGAYLRSDFRWAVLRELRKRARTSLAPCYGIDMETVVRHCLLAEKQQRYLWWGLATLAALLFFALLPDLRRVDGYFYTVEHVLADHAATLLIILTLAAVLAGSFDAYTRFTLIPRIAGGDLMSFANADDEEVVDDARNHLSGDLSRRNVVVYQKFTPFASLGIDWGGWSFSVDINRVATTLPNLDRQDIVEFDVIDLYSTLAADLSHGEDPSLQVGDHLYVDGARIRDLPEFLPNAFQRPLSFVPHETVRHYSSVCSSFCRHYMLVQHRDWNGDLIVSNLLRFVKSKAHLFAECHIFVLPPLDHWMKEIDEPDFYRMRPKKFLEVALSGGLKAMVMLPLSPFIAASYVAKPVSGWLEERQTRKRIARMRYYNYGAPESIRTIFSARSYEYFNQSVDRHMRVQVTQQAILNSIIDFLDEHNIDTSDIKDRQTAILNNGVIVAGGSLQASSVAVGAGAQASASASGGAEHLTRRLRERVKSKPAA